MSELNPEEERMLALLLKKQGDGGNVLRLIHGERVDSKQLEQLREIVKKIERGEIVEYTVIGVLKESGKPHITMSHSSPSALMISAVCHADEIIRRQMTFE